MGEMINKCAYLGCAEEGRVIDNVEIAPGVFEEKLVCEEHLGQLVGNYEKIANLECIFSKESD